MSLDRLTKVGLPLIGSFVAGFFGRFLGSEGSAIMTTPLFLLLLFVFLLCLILIFRMKLSRRRKSLILYCVILLGLGFFSYFLRLHVEHQIFALVGATTPFLFNLSDGSAHSDGEAGSLPPLESESSSASLQTYRNVIAAESEAEIYNRIRALENLQYFNVPPQNNMGDYERLVRSHFDQALNVDHYLEIWDKE